MKASILDRRDRVAGWRSQQGFTLFEIMLVVGIITILLGAGVYLLVGNIDVARESRVEADLATITTQLRTYEVQNLRLPSTEQGLQALVERPSGEPAPRRWRQLLMEVPLDPWGNQYQYRFPGERNQQSFDLYSFGPDGVDSDQNIGNW